MVFKPSKDEEDEYDEFEYNDNASFPPPPIHITEPDTDEYKVFDADDGFQIGGLKEKKNKKTVVCTTEGRDLRTQIFLHRSLQSGLGRSLEEYQL